ncbi:hypothetical protein BCR41DRAFT_344942 [Lobosporangium transversale]|uniref:Uncharacterized protein n=1 Tax=Lobosporangium transversale TaxID=64571 RepID=A0A1Y2H140_9FUNG|nr:hypothetical protein BCR41DRAFT_344942 [Lobosporangium transversale]ORZ28268.1 hypothetical protein BCR41DRAFT_344942 [Lobosporangium transversale]|eukprot:XP_021885953.1 hypothetical protein BCR41DRAFT_344942 [Lobosporangium transversale]
MLTWTVLRLMSRNWVSMMPSVQPHRQGPYQGGLLVKMRSWVNAATMMTLLCRA